MSCHRQNLAVHFSFPVIFTRQVFSPDNEELVRILRRRERNRRHRCLVVLDRGVLRSHPRLPAQIRKYFSVHAHALQLAGPLLILPGGEAVKQSVRHLWRVIAALDAGQICRQSFCLAIGGGAFLDAVGLAAALFHRGVRLVRIPATALAQCDSGVGVKNAINYRGAKNLLGTFAPPWAVINDTEFLDSLPLPLLLDGIAEAVKVAAIKDADFFGFIERNAAEIRRRRMPVIRTILRRCARLHMEHIARSGDPFEMGSARPLDYGHWAAHKLETSTRPRLSHGQAVAIGIALDALYAARRQLLPRADALRIVQTLRACGLPVYSPALHSGPRRSQRLLRRALEEFRAHLGGELTLTLPGPLGARQEIHSVNLAQLAAGIAELSQWT